jgi:hypothetical protein
MAVENVRRMVTELLGWQPQVQRPNRVPGSILSLPDAAGKPTVLWGGRIPDPFGFPEGGPKAAQHWPETLTDFGEASLPILESESVAIWGSVSQLPLSCMPAVPERPDSKQVGADSSADQ